MSDLKTLKSLFDERIYIIPDYQRGYIWGKQQLAEFWEDLLNIKDTPHYMGVLSIKKREKERESDTYEVIDGQQRLTTCIILIQAIIEFAEKEKNNFADNNNKILFSEYEKDSIENIKSRFLYDNNTTTNERKYKFQYICDNESSLCFNHTILKEPNGPESQPTLYTKKLENAKSFFMEKLREFYEKDGKDGIKKIYDKLVNKLKFNEFIIEKEFDVNVAFESMNNRGKKLSTLELLKNRLLFLTTLLPGEDKDVNTTKSAITDAWAEIYKQLGKNDDENKELLDDDFLRTHRIFYWGYSKQKGNDFAEFLLKKQFIRERVYDSLNNSTLITTSDYADFEDGEDNDIETNPDNLTLNLINDYTGSLKGCVSYWIDSFYPETAKRYQGEPEIIEWLNKFNRISAGAHFRPLITVALKKYGDECLSKELLIKLLETIERFVFIVFALNHSRSNSYDAKFYNYSRDLYKNINDVSVDKIIEDMNNILKNDCFADDGCIKPYFMEYIKSKFEKGKGYYGWEKISYFLYEYEMHLTKTKKRYPKVGPAVLLKPKDETIEHIYPQKDTGEYWTSRFGNLSEEEQKNRYKNALGNLLLLPQPINSSVQNDSFDEKKPYYEGSYSEQEVAAEKEWTPEAVEKRSKKLINFMEKRWDIRFKDEEKSILCSEC